MDKTALERLTAKVSSLEVKNKMSNSVPQTDQNKKKGQQHYSHGSTSTNRQHGGMRAQPYSQRSRHNTDRVSGFAQQVNSFAAGEGKVRPKEMNTKNGTKHPASATQSRSNAEDRKDEASASKGGEQYGNGRIRKKTDQDAESSTSFANRRQQHSTNHGLWSSAEHQQQWNWNGMSQSRGFSGAGPNGQRNYMTSAQQHLFHQTARAPHARPPPVQASSTTKSSREQFTNGVAKPAVQLHPEASAAQGKKSSKEQVFMNGHNSAVQAGTCQGTTVLRGPGTTQGTHTTPSWWQSGPQYDQQHYRWPPDKNMTQKKAGGGTAIPSGGTTQPIARNNTADKGPAQCSVVTTAQVVERSSTAVKPANKGTALSSGGTAQFIARNGIANPANKGRAQSTVVTAQPSDGKRTASQAFNGQGHQTAEGETKNSEHHAPTQTAKKQKTAAEPDSCPICLMEIRAQQLARPDACRHVFCLGCLHTWQQRKNTCPIDNQLFQTLVPCDQNGQDKMAMVENNNNRNEAPPAVNQPRNPSQTGQPRRGRNQGRNRRDRHRGQRRYYHWHWNHNQGNYWGDDELSWDYDNQGNRVMYIGDDIEIHFCNSNSGRHAYSQFQRAYGGARQRQADVQRHFYFS